MYSDLGVPLAPDADLDEFLQSLKKATDPAPPQLQFGSDLKSSHLTNAHQGDAAHRAGSAPLYWGSVSHVQATVS
jgi:hypothetical protein